MTSTLTLYYNTKLLPDKNLALDNAGSGKGVTLYLQTVTSKSIVGFQYIKHGLSISIRLNESQTKLAMGAGAEDLNYCRIQNGTENPLYYFVVGKAWKAQNTIELSLVMDTLNSFEFNVDYPLSAKTLVEREHHDRLGPAGISNVVRIGPIDFEEANASWSYFFDNAFFAADAVGDMTNYSFGIYHGVPDSNFTCTTFEKRNGGVYLEGAHTAGGTIRIQFDVHGIAYRKIHKPSEGIQSPKRKTHGEILIDGVSTSWNLLYRNKQTPDDTNVYDNPVECLLIPDSPLKIKAPTTDGVIDSSIVNSGEYMIMFSDYEQFSFEFEGVAYCPYTSFIGSFRHDFAYAIQNDSGTFKLYSIEYIDLTGAGSGSWTQIATASSPIKVFMKTSIRVRIDSSLPLANAIHFGSLYLYSGSNATKTLTTDGTQTVFGLDNVNRTDARNIKLIKLPYAPSDVSVDSNGFVSLSAEWVFDGNSNFIKLANPNTRFKHRVQPDTQSSLYVPMFVGLSGHTVEDDRDEKFESKLLHSDFHNPKFVYDSFVKNFDLERVDGETLAKQTLMDYPFEFTFVASRNIVSKFLFDFTQWDAFYIEETEDFNHIVCVARNNEEVLYSSQYLNYLRTGYNYDLKTKERTELSAGVGIGLNVAALMASIGISFIPGAQGIGLASAVASGFGLAGQLVSYAKNVAQGEQNIAQKLQEIQMQAVSVQNADDVDLLDYYCSNKAMYCEYDISDEMKSALWDLFHYCGYKTNLQKVPDKSTRYWFNFVQADLVFVDTANLNSDIEEDLKTRFKDGVTFLHYREGYGFNFEQQRENWEMAIVPYLSE